MVTPDNRGQPTAKRRPNFYSDAGAEDGPDEITLASKLEGLDDEIAVLRVKFKELLREEPVDQDVVLRTAEVLVRAVAAYSIGCPLAPGGTWPNT